jgi:hypothetical protein
MVPGREASQRFSHIVAFDKRGRRVVAIEIERETNLDQDR